MTFNLCDYYKEIQAQSTTSNAGNEICCRPGDSLQELAANQAKEKKIQQKLFIQIVTRNRPGIANRLCYTDL